MINIMYVYFIHTFQMHADVATMARVWIPTRKILSVNVKRDTQGASVVSAI